MLSLLITISPLFVLISYLYLFPGLFVVNVAWLDLAIASDGSFPSEAFLRLALLAAGILTTYKLSPWISKLFPANDSSSLSVGRTQYVRDTSSPVANLDVVPDLPTAKVVAENEPEKMPDDGNYNEPTETDIWFSNWMKRTKEAEKRPPPVLSTQFAEKVNLPGFNARQANWGNSTRRIKTIKDAIRSQDSSPEPESTELAPYVSKCTKAESAPATPAAATSTSSLEVKPKADLFSKLDTTVTTFSPAPASVLAPSALPASAPRSAPAPLFASVLPRASMSMSTPSPTTALLTTPRAAHPSSILASTAVSAQPATPGSTSVLAAVANTTLPLEPMDVNGATEDGKDGAAGAAMKKTTPSDPMDIDGDRKDDNDDAGPKDTFVYVHTYLVTTLAPHRKMDLFASKKDLVDGHIVIKEPQPDEPAGDPMTGIQATSTQPQASGSTMQTAQQAGNNVTTSSSAQQQTAQDGIQNASDGQNKGYKSDEDMEGSQFNDSGVGDLSSSNNFTPGSANSTSDNVLSKEEDDVNMDRTPPTKDYVVYTQEYLLEEVSNLKKAYGLGQERLRWRIHRGDKAHKRSCQPKFVQTGVKKFTAIPF